MKKNASKIANIICICIVGVISFLIIYKEALTYGSDYAIHLEGALSLKSLFSETNHPLWHWGVYLLHEIRKLTFDNPNQYIDCAFYSTIITLLVYACIRRLMILNNVKWPEFAALILSFVTAIYVPPFNERIYVGQGSPVTWHNPTNLMLKPFAILSFMLLLEICEKVKRQNKPSMREYLDFSVLIFIGALAKPSFFQGIVPTLAVYITIRLIANKGEGIIEYIKLCLSFAPTCILVLIQFINSFYEQDDAGGIGFGFSISAPYTSNVIISVLLVLAFPILYTILNYSKLKNKTETKLLWLFVFLTWIMRVCLYEKGDRYSHGNFDWASQIAYSIVWIYQIKNFLLDVEVDVEKRKIRIQNIILLSIMLMHLISGLVYCWQLLTIPGFWL